MKKIFDYLRALEAEIQPDEGCHHAFFTEGEYDGLSVSINGVQVIMVFELADYENDRYQFIVDVKNHVREFFKAQEEEEEPEQLSLFTEEELNG